MAAGNTTEDGLPLLQPNAPLGGRQILGRDRDQTFNHETRSTGSGRSDQDHGTRSAAACGLKGDDARGSWGDDRTRGLDT